MSTIRECPFCAEKILAEAKLCKHCNSSVTPCTTPNTIKSEPQNKKKETSLITWLILILIILWFWMEGQY